MCAGVCASHGVRVRTEAGRQSGRAKGKGILADQRQFVSGSGKQERSQEKKGKETARERERAFLSHSVCESACVCVCVCEERAKAGARLRPDFLAVLLLSLRLCCCERLIEKLNQSRNRISSSSRALASHTLSPHTQTHTHTHMHTSTHSSPFSASPSPHLFLLTLSSLTQSVRWLSCHHCTQHATDAFAVHFHSLLSSSLPHTHKQTETQTEIDMGRVLYCNTLSSLELSTVHCRYSRLLLSYKRISLTKTRGERRRHTFTLRFHGRRRRRLRVELSTKMHSRIPIHSESESDADE